LSSIKHKAEIRPTWEKQSPCLQESGQDYAAI
jgi:hypothetical protein